MKAQSKSDSFGTFLQTVQGAPAGREAPEHLKKRLLHVLALSGPRPLRDVIAASGMELTQFLDTLHSLRDLHLVTITKQSETDAEEVVALTPSGQDMAKLAE